MCVCVYGDRDLLCFRPVMALSTALHPTLELVVCSNQRRRDKHFPVRAPLSSIFPFQILLHFLLLFRYFLISSSRRIMSTIGTTLSSFSPFLLCFNWGKIFWNFALVSIMWIQLLFMYLFLFIFHFSVPISVFLLQVESPPPHTHARSRTGNGKGLSWFLMMIHTAS